MTNQQKPEALRLADELERDLCDYPCEAVALALRRQHARIAELEAELSAIGAGGVEPLRRRECLHQISETAPAGKYPALPEPDATTVGLGAVWNRHSMRAYVDAARALWAQAAPAAVARPSDSEIDALVVSIGPTEGIRKDSRDLTMDKLRVLVRRALATWGHVKVAPVNAWQQAIDHELVTAHLGVAGAATLEEARKALHELICWHIDVATDPATNGGKVLVDAAHAPAVPAAQGDALPWLQANDMAALERFAETTDDDESYDIGKEAVQRLAGFGCLRSHGFGKYSITDFGHYVLNDWSLARELPFKSQSERDAARSQAKEGGAS